MTGRSTPSRRAPRRQGRTPKLAVWLVGIALISFALGYAITAVLFFRAGRGDDIVTVPDLRWRSEADARALLERADLSMEVRPGLTNPQVPEGQILAQTPLPGEEVVPGSVVRVILSSGPERRRIPDVTALGGQQAQDLLIRSGFQVVVEERTTQAAPGRVVDISPPAGSEVEMPASIRLVISTGPPIVEVPELYGMTVEDARTVLEQSGLRLGNVDYDPLSNGQIGRVIGQWPAGGEQERSGAVVGITVAGTAEGNS